MKKSSRTSSKEKSHQARIQRQARICLGRGWSVVPIPRGRKGPSIQSWPTLRLKRKDLETIFEETDSIGVVLGEASRGLIDIDLDSTEAVRAAEYFLPETQRIHGRPSKPSSHFWYFVEPALEPTKFADPDGSTLLEYRSNGQQTLIPPSVHPSGERYKWESTGAPARIEGPILLKAVSRLAACALVARHWPEKGSRHEVTLALAGCLLRNGWEAAEVKNFVTAAAFASMTDEEWRSRHKDVESTLDRLVHDKPVTGIPRLTAFLGEPVVAKFMEWAGISPGAEFASFKPTAVSWPEPPKPEAFDGLAGEVVSLIEPHSEADPVALLSQLLVGFGNVIGRGPFYQVEADKHHTNLFAVLVGPTSKARKGSALSQVKRLLEQADEEWASHCILSGLTSGEGLVWATRDAMYSKDGEELVDVGVEDKRVLAVESEIAQQLKLMNREGNILSAILRQAWDSGMLRTLSKNSPAQATGAHISLIGHITQTEVRRYLTQTEAGNGFANRFLWLCVRRSKLLPEGGNLNDDDLQEVTERLKATISWARKVKRVHKSEQARRLWAEVYPRLSEGRAGLLGAVTSRAEAQVTRLALIYALFDRSSLITTKHLRAALALWEYAAASAAYIFGDSLGDPVADEILSALRVNTSGLTRTEISNVFTGHRKSADISRALLVLAQSGLASCRPEATGGRPDERWFVLAGGAKNAKKD